MRPFRVIRAARDHRGEGHEGDPGGCEEDRGAMVVGRGGGGGRIARRATGKPRHVRDRRKKLRISHRLWLLGRSCSEVFAVRYLQW